MLAVIGMEMRRGVVIVVHANGNSEKPADRGHLIASVVHSTGALRRRSTVFRRALIASGSKDRALDDWLYGDEPTRRLQLDGAFPFLLPSEFRLDLASVRRGLVQ